ncbi:MAG: hypothetical protein QM767_20680 [Anaeromyxobacter sp.]
MKKRSRSCSRSCSRGGRPWSGYWPRLKALKLEGKKGGAAPLYLFVAVGTMVGATVNAQTYLAKSNATVGRLGDVAEIARPPLARYYLVERPCLRRDGSRGNSAAALAGKNKRTLRFTISVVVPFCGRGVPYRAEPPPAWLALAYTETMEASRPEAERERRFQAFRQRAKAQFEAQDLADFTYLEVVRPGAARNGFQAAIGDLEGPPQEDVILEAHHEPFEARAQTDGWLALGFFGMGALLWLFMVAVAGVHPGKLRQLAAGSGASRKQRPRAKRAARRGDPDPSAPPSSSQP